MAQQGSRFSFEWGFGFLFPVAAIALIAFVRFGWQMGIAATVLFFASVLAHEAGHIIVATKHAVPVKAIGCNHLGVYIKREKADGAAEIAVSIAGPAVNLLLACVLLNFDGFCGWLGQMNAFLFIVNVLPLRGSDGYRILAELRARRTEPALVTAPSRTR